MVPFKMVVLELIEQVKTDLLFSLSNTSLPFRDCGQRIPHAKVVTTSLHCFCDPDFIHCVASFFPFMHESTLNCFLLYCHCIHVCYNGNVLMQCALQINLLVGLSNVIHALEVFIFVNPTHKFGYKLLHFQDSFFYFLIEF